MEPVALVVVRIGERRWGLPAGAVREVLPMLEPTPVPAWPECALGLIEVRGALFPLVELHGLLQQAPFSPRASQFVLVLPVEERLWGVVVDAVEGVALLAVTPAAQRAPAELARVSPLCQGVAAEAEGGAVVVLEPARVLQALALWDDSARAGGQEGA